jgi:hypothetical protein
MRLFRKRLEALPAAASQEDVAWLLDAWNTVESTLE